MERKTERELAAVVGISVPTVHKRIVKIRAALAEII
jgi:DNA-directed RNA polymerase specialized sigma24 family protein